MTDLGKRSIPWGPHGLRTRKYQALKQKLASTPATTNNIAEPVHSPITTLSVHIKIGRRRVFHCHKKHQSNAAYRHIHECTARKNQELLIALHNEAGHIANVKNYLCLSHDVCIYGRPPAQLCRSLAHNESVPLLRCIRALP